ncbi:MAG: hypothetical protein KAJ15_09400 [Spirochaetes bacterium]|nr:hypothetical protein [Spirochaetota bacterium]
MIEHKDDHSEYYHRLAQTYGECSTISGLFKKASYSRKMKKAALRAVKLDSENGYHIARNLVL